MEYLICYEIVIKLNKHKSVIQFNIITISSGFFERLANELVVFFQVFCHYLLTDTSLTQAFEQGVQLISLSDCPPSVLHIWEVCGFNIEDEFLIENIIIINLAYLEKLMIYNIFLIIFVHIIKFY